MRTFLAVDRSRIIGYYSLRAHEIEPDAAARALGVGRRRYPIPAVLLARLAIDRDRQGRCLGTQLLLVALERIAGLSLELGFELVIVHALTHDASVFYRKRGFTAALDDPLLLYLPVKDLRRTFEVTAGV